MMDNFFQSLLDSNMVVNVGIFVAIICAVLSPIGNGIYAYFYEDIIKPKDPLMKKLLPIPVIFYGTTGVSLLILGGVIALLQGHIGLSLDGYHWMLFALMVCGYALHILTEIRGRTKMNMTLYNIIFQSQIIFIILFSVYIFGFYELNFQMGIGAIFILVSGIFAILHVGEIGKTGTSNVRGILLTTLSAAAKGLAITIDAYLAIKIFGSSLGGFFLYEALTFLFPGILAYIYYYLSSGITFRQTLTNLKEEFDVFQEKYIGAGIGSASEYIFGVAGMILFPYLTSLMQGLTPVITAFVESWKRKVDITIISITFLCLAGIIIAFI